VGHLLHLMQRRQAPGWSGLGHVTNSFWAHHPSRVNNIVPCNLMLLLSFSLSVVSVCDPTDLSTPGFPVLHHFPELAQTHVHWVCDAIWPSRPVIPFSSCLQSFPAPGPFLMSQLFASGGQSIRAIWCTNAFSGGRKYNVGWSRLWPSSLAAWKKIWEIDSSVWIYWCDF